MTAQLILMMLGSVFCGAAAFFGWRRLKDAPTLFSIDFTDFTAVIGWAYVLGMVMLPIVCALCLLRGWIAYAQGPRELALRRLTAYPIALSVVCAALYGAAQLGGSNP